MRTAVAEVDAQLAFHHDEGLVGVGVRMPDEIAFQPNDLELVVVQLGNHPGLPLLAQQPELLPEIDGPIVHQSRWTHMAMPMPPPMQSVARPFLASRFCIS